jgi:hypothetical protein
LLWQGAIPLTVETIWISLTTPAYAGERRPVDQNLPLLPDIGRYQNERGRARRAGCSEVASSMASGFRLAFLSLLRQRYCVRRLLVDPIVD